MSTTYLTLVNRAIEEAGVDLDALTSGTFASTTNSMQMKFKRWVADAWKDIQTDRRGWHHRKKKGVYILQPRIEFYDGDAGSETQFNGVIITDSNDNWMYKVNGSVYVENGTFAAGTAEGWMNVLDEDGLLPITDPVKSSDLVYYPVVSAITFNSFSQDVDSFATAFAAGGIFYGAAAAYGVVTGNSTAGSDYVVTVAFYTQELYDDFITYVGANPLSSFQTEGVAAVNASRVVEYISDTQGDPASFRVLGWGRYRLDTVGPDSDPDSAISDLQEIDVPTVRIAPFSGAADVDYSTERQFCSVKFLTPWEWAAYGFGANKSLGQPQYYTIDTDGKYSFYPQPDKAYVLNFDYWRTPQSLSAHGDVIEGISDYYTEAIVWKAVMYWADYDEQSSKYNKASRRFMAIYNKMLRDYLEGFHFPSGVGEASFG